MSNQAEINYTLNSDVAYQAARASKNVIEMAIILRAYGYPHTLENAIQMIEFEAE